MSTGGRRREGLNQQKKGGEEGSRPNARLKKNFFIFSSFTCCRSRAAQDMTLPYMAEFIVDSNLSLFCAMSGVWRREEKREV